MRRLLVFSFIVSLGVTFAARADDGDRTGVDATSITIGVHAPFSGWVPVRPEAFKAGKDLYWKWLKARGGSIHGRDVQIVFANDQYNPTTAVSVCNQMATEQNAFLLIGFGGTDQINACAQYAEPRGIPYLSPGVQETGLSNRSTYFALSATYVTQMRTIAQYVTNTLGTSAERYGPIPSCPTPILTIPILDIPIPPDQGCTEVSNAIDVGLVRPNTPNFNDADVAFRAGLNADGVRTHVYTVVKEGNSSEMQDLATQMRADGIDVVVDLLAPSPTTQLALYMDGIFYRPLILGDRDGFDQIPQNACNGKGSAMDGASYFSAWPAYSDASTFDPDFVEAAHEFAPNIDAGSGADVMFALWGLMKDVAGMLDAAGSDPTREGFIAAMNSGFQESTGVYPPLSVSSANHFGAQAMHRIEADCADSLFHEKDAFVSEYAKP